MSCNMSCNEFIKTSSIKKSWCTIFRKKNKFFFCQQAVKITKPLFQTQEEVWGLSFFVYKNWFFVTTNCTLRFLYTNWTYKFRSLVSSLAIDSRQWLKLISFRPWLLKSRQLLLPQVSPALQSLSVSQSPSPCPHCMAVETLELLIAVKNQFQAPVSLKLVNGQNKRITRINTVTHCSKMSLRLMDFSLMK